MANTRKPVKPKAGAKPATQGDLQELATKLVTNEVLSVGSGTGITVDYDPSSLYDGISGITGIPSEDVEHLFEDDESDEDSPDAPYTPTAEEIAAVLAFIKSQTASEILKDNTDYALNVADAMLGVLPVEKSTKELFVKVYDVVDTITGTSIRPEDNGALTLSGRVTDADLDAAGVDKAWLLRIGAIVDAGYAGG